MSATITDLARHAGVAPSTVSYVLTGNRRISVATRRRVETSIRALKYHRHAGARSLRSGRTDVIGLVVPITHWSNERVLMPYVYGVLQSARQHGWNVILLTGPDGRSEIDSVVWSKMVDGLILMEIQGDDERVAFVAELARPAVLLGVPDDARDLPCVDFDFEAAGRLCVQYLHGLGHTHLGFLAPPPGVFDMGLGFAFRTWRGVADALSELQLVLHAVPTETTQEGVNSALQQLLDEVPLLTALIVHNEGILDLIVPALERLGRRVPDDVSILVIARKGLARHVAPPLTCVAVPADEMGRQAIEMLSSWDGSGRRRLLPPIMLPGASDSPPVRYRRSTNGRHASGRSL